MSQPPYPQHPDPQQPPPGDVGRPAGADQHGAPDPYSGSVPYGGYGQPVPPQHQLQFPQQAYPTYPLPQYQGYAPHPAPRPVRGPLPTVLNVIGGLMLAAGLGLMLMAAILFWRVLPTDVIGADGGPGSQSVTHGVPGETVVATLDPDERYMVYQVQPQGSGHEVLGEPEIRAPDGEVDTAGSAQFSSEAAAGGMVANARWSFAVDQPGEHEITLPESSGAGPEGELFFVVTAGGEISDFLGGLFGTLGGIFGGLFLCFVGGVLLLIGIILGVTRRRRRRQYEQQFGAA